MALTNPTHIRMVGDDWAYAHITMGDAVADGVDAEVHGVEFSVVPPNTNKKAIRWWYASNEDTALVYKRIATTLADDSWPGARYEAVIPD